MQALSWEECTFGGVQYTSRTGHTVCSLGSRIYVFGGTDAYARKNDLHCIDMRKMSAFPIDIKGERPASRSGAQSLTSGNFLFLFGGYEGRGGRFFNDLWSFDLRNLIWKQITTPDDPPHRVDHAFVYANDCLWVHGGRGHDFMLGDLWYFNTKSGKWAPGTNVNQRGRFGHTAVVIKDLIYFFGGWNGTTTLNDMFTYDTSAHIWSSVPYHGLIDGRYRHCAVNIGDKVYIFGGINGRQERFNDLYVFDPKTKMFSSLPTEHAPTPRTFHTSCVVENALLIVGGYDGNRLNDVHRIQIENPDDADGPYALGSKVFSGGIQAPPKHRGDPPLGDREPKLMGQSVLSSLKLSEYEWSKIDGIGEKYSARTGHECVAHLGKLYVFAGTDDVSRKNDLYEFNFSTNKWKLFKVVGFNPSQRSGGRGVGYQNGLYFFGGCSKSNGIYFNDFNLFNLSTESWSILQFSGSVPSPRTDHSASLYNKSLVIFGGYDGNSRYNDLHICNLSTLSCSKLANFGDIPLTRFGHTATICGDYLMVFGGWNGHETLDELYQYSFTSNYWYEIKRANGERPSSRYRHGSGSIGGQLYVFGGVDQTQARFNDCFKYDVQSKIWQKVKYASPVRPSPRSFHRVCIVENYLMVVGGFDGKRLNCLYALCLKSTRGGALLSSIEGSAITTGKIKTLKPEVVTQWRTIPSDMPMDEIEEEEKAKTMVIKGGTGDTTELVQEIDRLKAAVKELSQRLKDEEDRHVCKICYSRMINTVILNCGHRLSCYQCFESYIDKNKNCPICRSPIQNCIRTYDEQYFQTQTILSQL